MILNMADREPPGEAVCTYCGANSTTRGQLMGRDFFRRSAELILLMWIQCPNCGDVTQPVVATTAVAPKDLAG